MYMPHFYDGLWCINDYVTNTLMHVYRLKNMAGPVYTLWARGSVAHM